MSEEKAPIADFSLSIADWCKMLGVADRPAAIAKLAAMTKEEADPLIKKLSFKNADYNMAVSHVAAARSEAAKPPADSNKNDILAALGLGGAAAGAVGVAEIAGRFAEMINGVEQTYRGAIDLNELKKQFEGALSGSDIAVSLDLESNSIGNFIFRDEKGKGAQLLAVRVRNLSEKATAAQSAYDAIGTRLLPLAEVKISKSDIWHLVDKGVEAAETISDGFSQLSQIQDISGVMNALNTTLDAGRKTYEEGKEVFDVGNLPRLVADVIEKMARQAEESVTKQTGEIYKRNLNRLQEVSGGLVCLYCGRPRPDSDADPSCGGCGAPLEKRHEPVSVLKADIVKLAEIGLIKSA